MRSSHHDFKQQVIALRRQGKTYGAIRKALQREIPKSTLSLWCHDIVLSPQQIRRIDSAARRAVSRGRMAALSAKKAEREAMLASVKNSVAHLGKKILGKDVAKVALAMLYLGEGSKTKRSSLMFGNSNPAVIVLFLGLLRRCYVIDENKFRCTVQCRADQKIAVLEKFWSRTTRIPPRLFYDARIDTRTKGKPSLKPDYKGVCRIDYFSAKIANEINCIIKVIEAGL